MLSLAHDWIWDSWVVDDGGTFHLYFLRAPRALGDPGRRHHHAQIGHATSTDLREWTDHGVVLSPTPGSWDDLAVWSGSVTRGDDGIWRMYYTAINTRGHGLKDQQIGLAESDDLYRWRKVGSAPVLTVDPRLYRTLDGDPAASETWRDPFVYRDPDGGWRMLITARIAGGRRNDDGVLAMARSPDLRRWEVLAPVTSAGTGFGQIEVAQIRVVDGQAVLVFTCHPDEQTEERRRGGDFCTWSVLGASSSGPWDIAAARPFVAEPKLFAAPLVRDRTGQWVLLGFRNQESDGIYSFDVIDPIPVAARDGVLAVGTS
jgi:beta-fructofuranosidase